MTDDSEIPVIRLEDSEEFHYTRNGKTPACWSDDATIPDEPVGRVSNVESAEEFFELCEVCEATYDVETGLTSQELREFIREYLHLEPDGGKVFTAEELAEIYRQLGVEEATEE